MNNNIFVWDKYSDQPYPIKDREFKKKQRSKNKLEYLKLALTNMLFFPTAAASMKAFTAKNNHRPYEKQYFYGLGVNLDKGDIQYELVEELGVKSLIIRIPLSDISNLYRYYLFVQRFKQQDPSIDILLNILQDRVHIENKQLLRSHIIEIFHTFKELVTEYQIGNAINRMKWGFYSIKEYIEFYQVVQQVRDEQFPNIKLIGPSVIDFEYYYTIRALFNSYNISYDKLGALLYVDRRGDPKNKQLGIFDTKNKIDMLYALVQLSSKCKSDEIYITEVNWPLKGTAPYAPTSPKECVDEFTYSKYMLEYFDIAYKTQKISKVFWHQLIAPGYGLVDNRDGKIRKMDSFYKFKRLLQELDSE